MRNVMVMAVWCSLMAAAVGIPSDFNRNGFPDFFAWNANGVDWYERGSDGGFIKAYNDLLTLPNLNDVIVGDVNKDGMLELIVAVGGSNGGVYCYQWKNNALVQVASIANYPAAAVALGYFDPDGFPDLFVGQNNGDGTGRFDWFEYRFGPNVNPEGFYWVAWSGQNTEPVKRRQMAVVEAGGAGWFFYVPDKQNNYVNGFRSTSDNQLVWTWWSDYTYNPNKVYTSLLVDDVDGDGYQDIYAVVSGSEGGWTIRWEFDNSGLPVFKSWNQFTSPGAYNFQITKSGYLENLTNKSLIVGGNDWQGWIQFDATGNDAFTWKRTDLNPILDLVILRYDNNLARGELVYTRTDGSFMTVGSISSNGYWSFIATNGESYNALIAAENITPSECGDAGIEYAVADFNRDCIVDLQDLLTLASQWLVCTDPSGCN